MISCMDRYGLAEPEGHKSKNIFPSSGDEFLQTFQIIPI